MRATAGATGLPIEVVAAMKGRGSTAFRPNGNVSKREFYQGLATALQDGFGIKEVDQWTAFDFLQSDSPQPFQIYRLVKGDRSATAIAKKAQRLVDEWATCFAKLRKIEATMKNPPPSPLVSKLMIPRLDLKEDPLQVIGATYLQFWDDWLDITTPGPRPSHPYFGGAQDCWYQDLEPSES